jgi:PRTRC genetic system ThiF family protein
MMKIKYEPSIANNLCTSKYPVTIELIGAGGTGSQVLQQLGRIHMALQAMSRPGLMVRLWDGDTVTAANAGRQLFTRSEYNRNKADVLIERVNRFYGTSWHSVPRHMTEEDVRMGDVHGNIIITCVDKVAPRELMQTNIYTILPTHSKTHDGFANHFWIDTGNSKTTGQVICGSRKHSLPTILDIEPNLKKFEDQDDSPSCSLAEALDRQHLFINTIIGNICAMLVFDICSKPILTWYGAYINMDGAQMVNKIIGREESNQVPPQQRRKRRNNSTEAASAGPGPEAAGGG